MLDQYKSNFTIKTLEELISLLDFKGEKEFTKEIMLIFGENNNTDYTNDMVENFGLEIATKKINFREVIATLAFFRLDNYHAKIRSNLNLIII